MRQADLMPIEFLHRRGIESRTVIQDTILLLVFNQSPVKQDFSSPCEQALSTEVYF